MTPEEQAADLLANGYVEITEHGRLYVGQRVHHIGERYSDAYHNGTATIVRMFKHPKRIIQGRKDIELIALKDKPLLPHMPPYGYWADYHTIPVVTP